MALKTLMNAIFCQRNNLIGTDISRVRTGQLSASGPEGHVRGREVTFTISNDALGKVMNAEVSDAIDVLEKSNLYEER